MKQESNKRNMEGAFGDLKKLMQNAEDMVQLAKRYTQSLSADDEKKQSNEDKAEFDSILFDMGIPNPVTKGNAGSAYHVQLSRQLADFLHRPLEKTGGMMALTDVFCVFNRARGTEMVSPEDLLAACQNFEQLDLPLRLRKFDSGVLVVQSEEFSDDTAAIRILQVAAERYRNRYRDEFTDTDDEESKSSTSEIMPSRSSLTLSSRATAILQCPMNASISSLELAQALNISMVVAKQYLATSESLGYLCRDHSSDGLRYHANWFAVQ